LRTDRSQEINELTGLLESVRKREAIGWAVAGLGERSQLVWGQNEMRETGGEGQRGLNIDTEKPAQK